MENKHVMEVLNTELGRLKEKEVLLTSSNGILRAELTRRNEKIEGYIIKGNDDGDEIMLNRDKIKDLERKAFSSLAEIKELEGEIRKHEDVLALSVSQTNGWKEEVRTLTERNTILEKEVSG